MATRAGVKTISAHAFRLHDLPVEHHDGGTGGSHGQWLEDVSERRVSYVREGRQTCALDGNAGKEDGGQSQENALLARAGPRQRNQPIHLSVFLQEPNRLFRRGRVQVEAGSHLEAACAREPRQDLQMPVEAFGLALA